MKILGIILLCSVSVFGQSFTFIACEIHETEAALEFEEIYQKDKSRISCEDFEKIKNAGLTLKRSIDVDADGKIVYNNFNKIQYATKNESGYELVFSEKKEGLSCNLEVIALDKGEFILKGHAQILGVSRRAVFDPFPELDAGFPEDIMGGSFDGGVLVPSTGYGIATCVRSGNKYSGKRKVSLVLVRYEMHRVPEVNDSKESAGSRTNREKGSPLK
jgi:hypothetical protein